MTKGYTVPPSVCASSKIGDVHINKFVMDTEYMMTIDSYMKWAYCDELVFTNISDEFVETIANHDKSSWKNPNVLITIR